VFKRNDPNGTLEKGRGGTPSRPFSFHPARATQPCNCGHHGGKLKQCKCAPQQIEKYLAKISGPLLDRIAIHVSVRPVDIEAWKLPSTSSMTSAAMC
jgi:magnesium chelatase family protein